MRRGVEQARARATGAGSAARTRPGRDRTRAQDGPGAPAPPAKRGRNEIEAGGAGDDTGAPAHGKAHKYRPFSEALTYVHTLALTSEKAWRVWVKTTARPPDVPSRPDNIYKDGGWEGWGNWLGTGNRRHSDYEFLPFSEALAMARSVKSRPTTHARRPGRFRLARRTRAPMANLRSARRTCVTCGEPNEIRNVNPH